MVVARLAVLAIPVWCITIAPAIAQPVKPDIHALVALPSQESAERRDRHGDDLPPRAVARFGTCRLRHDGAHGIALSPDGAVLVSFSDADLRLWDTRTGKEFAWLLHTTAASVRISKVSFSADGKNLFTQLSTLQGQRWDLATGKALELELAASISFPEPTKATSVGKLRASLDRHVIRLESLPDKKRLQTPAGHDGEVRLLAISHDGRWLASVGADGQVHLWEVARTELRHTWAARNVLCLGFAPDGRTLAIGEGIRGPKSDAALGLIRILDVAKGAERHRFASHGQGVFTLAFSPDGNHLLSAGADNRARLWDASNWKELRQFSPRQPRDPEHTPNPWAVAFSPDGAVIATCGEDEEINLWPADASKAPLRIPRHWFLSFRPDGTTLLAQNHFGHLSVRDVGTGKEITSARTLGWLATPDGRMLLARAPDGRELLLRDWTLDKAILAFQGHRGRVTAAVFAPDGRSLFTGSNLGDVLQWEVPSLARIQTEHLWAMLMQENEKEAAKAVLALVDDPKDTLPFLKARVRPAGTKTTVIAPLIARLDHDDFSEREEASRLLEAIGALAEPELKAALRKKPSAEFRQRAESLLARLGGATGPHARAMMRSVRVLELLGNAEAREVLRLLADGYPAAPLTREAMAALERLSATKKP